MVCRERLGSDTVVGFVVKEFHSLFLCHYIFNLIFSNCIKSRHCDHAQLDVLVRCVLHLYARQQHSP